MTFYLNEGIINNIGREPFADCGYSADDFKFGNYKKMSSYNRNEILGFLQQAVPQMQSAEDAEACLMKLAKDNNFTPAVFERTCHIFNGLKLNNLYNTSSMDKRGSFATTLDVPALMENYIDMTKDVDFEAKRATVIDSSDDFIESLGFDVPVEVVKVASADDDKVAYDVHALFFDSFPAFSKTAAEIVEYNEFPVIDQPDAKVEVDDKMEIVREKLAYERDLSVYTDAIDEAANKARALEVKLASAILEGNLDFAREESIALGLAKNPDSVKLAMDRFSEHMKNDSAYMRDVVSNRANGESISKVAGVFVSIPETTNLIFKYADAISEYECACELKDEFIKSAKNIDRRPKKGGSNVQSNGEHEGQSEIESQMLPDQQPIDKDEQQSADTDSQNNSAENIQINLGGGVPSYQNYSNDNGSSKNVKTQKSPSSKKTKDKEQSNLEKYTDVFSKIYSAPIDTVSEIKEKYIHRVEKAKQTETAFNKDQEKIDRAIRNTEAEGILNELLVLDPVLSNIKNKDDLYNVLDVYRSLVTTYPAIATDRAALRSALRYAASINGGIDLASVESLAGTAKSKTDSDLKAQALKNTIYK